MTERDQAVVSAEATEIYRALAPFIGGKPIDAASMALAVHVALMIDQAAPGMGEARKACTQFGEQLWQQVVTMRAEKVSRPQ